MQHLFARGRAALHTRAPGSPDQPTKLRETWRGKVSLLATALSLFTAAPAMAQIATYTTAQGTTPCTDISGNPASVVIPVANTNNATSAAQPIGFTFSLGSNTFTQFMLNTNGFIKLGNAGMTGPSTDALFSTSRTSIASGTGALASTDPANENIISATNTDWTGGTGVEFRRLTTGTAPNRVTTIQFKNLADNWGTQQYQAANFQIILEEGTNKVYIKHGVWTQSTTNTTASFIASSAGLKGEAGDVRTVTKASGTSSIGASFGTTPTGTWSFTRSTVPVNGTTYTFTPPPPTPRAVGTITGTQPSTAVVAPGSQNEPVLRVIIPVSGNLGTLTLNELTVTDQSSAGTAPYITAVKLWYLNGSSTAAFSTTTATLIGTTTLTAGSAIFTGLTQQLNTSVGTNPTNVLFVTYDIAASMAAVGRTIDAMIEAGNIVITADAGATAPGGQPLTDVNPSGSRTISYCASNATSTSDEDIGRVRFANIDNVPGGETPVTSNPNPAAAYTDFTAITGTVSRGEPYLLTVNITNRGTSVFTTYVTAFVDFNQNGSFEDAGEQVYSEVADNSTPATVQSRQTQALVTIPLTAMLGTTRMRIVASETAPQGPCGTYSFGETEDYTLNIQPAPACPSPTGVFVSRITATSARVNFNSPGAGNTVEVEYGPTGFTPGTGTSASGLTGGFYDIPAPLTPGTNYDVYVTRECGGGAGNSSAFGPVAFTTPLAPLNFNVTGPAATTFVSINEDPLAQTVTAWRGGTSTTQNLSDDQPIGFAFNYLGTNYRHFRVSIDGFITFDTVTAASGIGGTGVAYGNDNTTLSASGASQTRLALAPFYDDLSVTNTADLLESIKYKLEGTAPNRILTVQWNEATRFTGTSLTFQVKLYEGTNRIEYVYGTMSLYSPNTAPSAVTYSVGMSGSNDQQTFLQQLENTRWFANAPKHDLSLQPECATKLTFTPGTYAAYTGTVSRPEAINDECAGAIALTVGTSPAVTYCGKVYTTNGATASAGIPACSATTPGSPDDDVWFSFTIGSNSNVNIAVQSSDLFNSVIQLFSGSCGSLTPVACENVTTSSDTREMLLATLTAGTYYVRVYHQGTGTAGNGTFAIDVFTVPNPPANDECVAAVPVTLGTGGAWGALVNGTSAGATESPNVNACGTGADDDVWYSFVPASTQVQFEVVGVTGYRPVIQILAGTCGNQSAASADLACVTGSLVPTGVARANRNGLTPGTTYYVRVFHSGTFYGGTGGFTIRGRNLPAPPNDNPAAAGAGSPFDLPVSLGAACSTPTNGTTLGATATPGMPAPALLPTSPDDDVFYSFVVPAGVTDLSVTVTPRPNETPINAIIQALDNTLTTEVGYANNTTSTTDPEVLDLTDLTPGARYYLRVYSSGTTSTTANISTQGEFTICVGEAPKAVAAVTVTQSPTGTTTVPQGGVNQTVLRTQIRVSGTLGSLPLQSITFVKSAETNLNNLVPGSVRLWASDTLELNTATATQLGTSGMFNAVTGAITFSGLNYDLPAGNTYLFLTVSVRSMATLNDTIDATVPGEGIVIAGQTYPSVTANPTGLRRVGPPPPANDEICGALPLTVYQGNQRPVGTTVTTTSATTNTSYPAPSCATTYNRDVWYRLTVPSTGQVLVGSRSGTGMTTVIVQLFASSNGLCSGTLTQIACDDDLGSGTVGVVRVSGRTPGETLWVRVSGTSSTGGTATLEAVERPVWMGTSSTAFNTLGNFVPLYGISTDLDAALAAHGLAVPAGATNYPSVTTVETLGGLTIYPGATFTLTSSTLTINGPFINNGTFTALPAASLVFGGATAATIGGNATTFENLTVGTGGLTLNTNTSVRRVLTLNGPLTTNGRLTLVSNATTSAMVVHNAAGSVTGNTTMQRYIDPSISVRDTTYRHLSAPVMTTIADLTVIGTPGYVPKVNPAWNSDTTARPFPTIFRYDETRITPVQNDFVDGYFSPSSTGEVMAPMVGYTALMRDNVHPDFVGPLNNGNYSRTGLTRGTETESGWHLLGNPYPAPLDWALVDNSQVPNMNGAISILRSTEPNSANYISYTNGVGSAKYVPVAQGFFMRTATPGVAGSVSLTNADRVTAYQNPAHYRSASTQETRPLVKLTLVQSGKPVEQGDETFVYFEAGATPLVDNVYDAFKIRSTGVTPSLFSVAGTEAVAINGMPELNATVQTLVPLGVQVGVTGTYKMNAAEVINFPAGMQVLLRDALTGTDQDLTINPTYVFTMDASFRGTRFTLVFNPQRVTGLPGLTAGQVAVYPNPVAASAELQVRLTGVAQTVSAVSAQLVDALGRVVTQASLPVVQGEVAGKLSTGGLSKGVYTLKLSAGEQQVTRRVVIE